MGISFSGRVGEGKGYKKSPVNGNLPEIFVFVWGCKLNCVIFIFDSTVGDRPSAKGVHQHSRRA